MRSAGQALETIGLQARSSVAGSDLVSLCHDCETPIYDEATRIFCDDCLFLNDLKAAFDRLLPDGLPEFPVELLERQDG